MTVNNRVTKSALESHCLLSFFQPQPAQVRVTGRIYRMSKTRHFVVVHNYRFRECEPFLNFQNIIYQRFSTWLVNLHTQACAPPETAVRLEVCSIQHCSFLFSFFVYQQNH